jgi:hypothetical protein
VNLFVLTSITRTTPSLPGYVSLTRPRLQHRGGRFSSTRIFVADFHLVRCCSCDTYSRCQRFQKCWRSCSISCQRDRRFTLISVKSCSNGAVRTPPISKWLGVSAFKSLGSLEIGNNGREFKQASILVKSVYISSYVKMVSPMTRFMWYFTDFIPTFQKPPKLGDLGGMNDHEMFVVC